MPAKTQMRTQPTHPPVGTLIDDDSLELVEIIGVGGYGVVYRAEETYSSSPISYAVKCLTHSVQNSVRQRQAHIREIALHQLASVHPNVITLHRVVEDLYHTYVIMDYASHHDLFTQILHGSRYLGDDQLIKHVLLQIFDAVEYCHALGIYHRDLKPENVLCFDEGTRVAITDFGLATTDKVSDEFRTGSIYHMSPECHGGEFAPNGTYSPMFNDIWSLGIILLNLATGRNPWKTASLSDPTFQAYCRDPSGFLPTVLPISQEINDVLIQMLALDWRERISLPELREAIENVTTFYSDSAVFEGSMARCSWEVDMDTLDNDAEAGSYNHSASIVMSQHAVLKSFWSSDSGSPIEFANRSSTASMNTKWIRCSESGGSSNWIVESYSMDRKASSSSSARSENFPQTPIDAAVNTRRLTINTDCAGPHYYTGDSSAGSYTTATSFMPTAVGDDDDSSFYLAQEFSSSPSKLSLANSKRASLWEYAGSMSSRPSSKSYVVACNFSISQIPDDNSMAVDEPFPQPLFINPSPTSTDPSDYSLFTTLKKEESPIPTRQNWATGPRSYLRYPRRWFSHTKIFASMGAS